jgi:hypothetical protein
VYLHKAVLGGEQLLIKILRRAKELAANGEHLFAPPALTHFLYNDIDAIKFASDMQHLRLFCNLDDSDILSSIKVWQSHRDPTLALLSKMMINRNLYKIMLSANPLEEVLEEKQKIIQHKWHISDEMMHYYVFTGTTSNNTYNKDDERIGIALKNGTVIDISEVDNPLVNQALARPVHKNYICYVAV